MKILAFVAAIVFAAQPVFAEELSLDTKRSLASMQTDLEALTAPSGTEVVALAAVTFLRAIEVAMQERYRTNAYVDNSMISIPILRLPVPPNPDPDPFKPSDVTDMFERVDDDMDRVRAAIAKGAMSAQDKLVVDVAALWFDVNADGKRDTGEGAMEFIGAALAGAIPVSPSGATGGPDQVEVPSEG